MTYWNEMALRLRGLSLMIDPTNSCSFRCPSCPVGNMPQRKGGKMDYPMFKQIIDTVRRQVKIKNLLHYSWSEPFLDDELWRKVWYAHNMGIWQMVSTNLSRPKWIGAVMAAGLDELRISFSGWKMGEYFHTGRDLKQFEDACNEVSRLMWDSPTKVSLIWHQYKTNQDEKSQVEKFAKSHGFHLIYEPAFIMPYEKHVSQQWTPSDLELISHLNRDPRIPDTRKVKEFCYYQSRQLCIDALGRVLLCRHCWDESNIVGHILENSVWGLLDNMERHAFCVECKAHRLNQYA